MGALPWTWVVIRGRTALAGLSGQVRNAIWEVDPDQPVGRIAGLGTLVDETLTSERMGTGVVGSFALVGMLLTALGIYGVVSYTVSRSLREMGIRLALGAEPRRVMALVFRQAGSMVAVGLLFGAAGAALFTREITRFRRGHARLLSAGAACVHRRPGPDPQRGVTRRVIPPSPPGRPRGTLPLSTLHVPRPRDP